MDIANVIHRYLEYLIKRRDAKKSTKEAIDLPKSDSYFSCWKQSLLSDYENLQGWDKFKEFNLINDSRCIENIKVDASGVTNDYSTWKMEVFQEAYCLSL